MDAEHLAFLRQQRQELRALRDRRTEATATSSDGLISATVDGRGRLVDLWLDARVYRSPDSKAFSRLVVDTIHAAAKEAAR
jgi:DNA-binding protein YbaB